MGGRPDPSSRRNQQLGLKAGQREFQKVNKPADANSRPTPNVKLGAFQKVGDAGDGNRDSASDVNLGRAKRPFRKVGQKITEVLTEETNSGPPPGVPGEGQNLSPNDKLGN